MMEHGVDNTRQSNHNCSVQDLTDDLSYSFCFMMSDQSTINFPFGDRQALVSIDSNCSRHMTGFYRLQDAKPCHVLVDGAIESGKHGVGRLRGTMQLGNISFQNTIFVPGIRETIISLGQLDKAAAQKF